MENKKHTAVQDLINELKQFKKFPLVDQPTIDAAIEFAELRLEMEKQQSIDLIKQSVMFMAASHLDEDIAKMSFEDVYNTYYNKTYEGNK